MTWGHRAAVLMLLTAMMASGVIADHLVGRPTALASGGGGAQATTQAAPGAVSSAWFCPPATAVPDGLADGRIVIANPAGTVLTGTVTVVPNQGLPLRRSVSVLARQRLVLRPGDIVKASYAAVTVELDGASGVVEQQVRGALGESVAPCATRSSDHWYFAAGSTARDDQLLITLYNPFPDDAVVNLSFATDVGPATPADLQGVVIAGRGLGVINVGDHVRRRDALATTVAVRSGRVVAGKIQLHGGGGSTASGVSLTIGQPAPGLRWYFPEGGVGNGVDEHYEVFNPGPNEALVRMALVPDRGTAEPIVLTVAPQDRVTFVVGPDTGAARDVGHAGVVASDNGVPFVVERVITAAPPSRRLGISDLMGSLQPDKFWLFAAGAADSAQDERIVVFNPGPVLARASVTLYSNGRPVRKGGLDGVAIAAGRRVVIRVGTFIDAGDLMVAVNSADPVVVERDLSRTGAKGMSSSLGIPSGQ